MTPRELVLAYIDALEALNFPVARSYLADQGFEYFGPNMHFTSADEMLTFLFGTVAFTDSTHIDRNMGERSYTSFESAAYEAAISRLYGGIHFRAAIENGVRMGECISQAALDNIVMRPLSQGE